MEPLYWPSVFFLLFSLLACSFAVAVLLTSNVVRMAFYLVLSLAATAGLMFLAGAEFVGAMQLLIYVGGTLVLLIFGVMLTSQERFVEMKTWAGDWVWGLGFGTLLLTILTYVAAFNIPAWRGLDRATAEAIPLQHTVTPIALGLLGARPDAPDSPGYLLPFEIVSVHLLVVLIGAAYLARAKRSKQP